MQASDPQYAVVVDLRWLEQLDNTMAVAIDQIHRAIEQLSFESNARFIEQRGRTVLALDKLRSAEQRLLTARSPWLL